MDTAEARRLLTGVLEPLQNLSYTELVERFVDGKPENLTVVGDSGVRYYAEVDGFWEGAKPGPLRVVASIDDGGLRAFVPVSDSFIKAEDGGLIGE